VTSEPETSPKRRRRWTRLGLTTGGLVVVVATFAFVLPQIATYRDVWAVITGLSAVWIAALAGATVLNLSTFPPPWMAALPGLGYRHAFVMTQASTALSLVVPGGAAVGMAGSYGMLRSWGLESARVARAVTLTGVWNQLATFLFPVIGVALLAGQTDTQPLLGLMALVGAGVFGVLVAGLVLVLWRDRLARDLGDAAARFVSWLRRRIRRGPVSWGGAAFVRFRHDTVGLLRRRWQWLTLATLAGHLTVFIVLVVSLRAVGVDADRVSLAEAFASWSLVRVLGALPITPGGVGVVELGLTGLLVGFGGRSAAVVAAVLLYRFLTVVPTLALGLLGVATWRWHRPRAA
jgi:putative heme transporter